MICSEPSLYIPLIIIVILAIWFVATKQKFWWQLTAAEKKKRPPLVIIFAALLVLGLVVFVMAGQTNKKNTTGPTPTPAPTVILLPTPESKDSAKDGCVRSGCSGEICIDVNSPPMGTTCVEQPWFHCYRKADCKRQVDGKCGFTQTDELAQCLEKFKP